MAFFKSEEESASRRFIRSFMVTFGASIVVVFLIVAAVRDPNPRQAIVEPALTEEEYVEELNRLQDLIIKHKEELIELYKLKKLEAEGKLRSS